MKNQAGRFVTATLATVTSFAPLAARAQTAETTASQNPRTFTPAQAELMQRNIEALRGAALLMALLRASGPMPVRPAGSASVPAPAARP